MPVICYLGLGSNLKSPKRQLNTAISSLNKLKKAIIIDISSLYFTKPIGVKSQPMYYNLVLSIKTSLTPLQLLSHCKDIEYNQQRVHKKKWGSRTIDIDILTYGNQVIKKSNLIIPHPYMLEREFVMQPLLEIHPDFGLKKTYFA